MANKNITLLLNLHHPYIRHSEDSSQENEHLYTLLFEKISNVYIPLLNLIASLERDNIKFKIPIVFSSTLCTLLSDSIIKEKYVNYLDNLIEFGKKEILRTKNVKEINRNATLYFEKTLETKRYFTEVYEQNLLKYFSKYAKKGLIEILATCGTYMFMPHYSDIPEILNAQIETGLYAVRYFFGISAEGFFLPELGYAPGIEKVLRMYGVNYTILSSQSFLLGSPSSEKGIFAPARCYNCLSLFASDQMEIEYNQNPVYKNRNIDIAWELELSNLNPLVKQGEARTSSGFCYWNKSFNDSEIESKNSKKSEYIYNFENAANQIILDADDFASKYSNKLNEASLILKDTDVLLTCVFDEEMLFNSWDEGLIWYENVIRKFNELGVNVTSFSDLLFDKFSLQKITPYYGASVLGSYGEEFLSGKNSWLIRYLRKSSQILVDLAGRFPDDTGLKVRLLNLGAKELMLAQSSEWAKMIESNVYSEYEKKTFKDSIIAFTNVFDALGSNTVSTEWLCNLEKEHPIFPWMNFRIFCKKK